MIYFFDLLLNLLGDPAKARKVLGWDPCKTPLEELVRRMVEHDMALVRKEGI